MRVLRRTADRRGTIVLVTKYQPAFFQIVRRNLDRDPIAGKGLDAVFLHSAGRIGGQFVAIVQTHAEACVGQYFENQTFELQELFF